MAARARPTLQPTTVLLLLALTLVALALRLPSFTDSLWGDELSTNFVVHGFGVGGPISIIEGDQEGTPPLFFLAVWLFKGIDGAEGLRIVSLLAGLAAIPLVYLLGIRTVGAPAATVAAVLLALSPFQIFYSTEARAYSLSMALLLVVALTLLSALDSGRTRWWVAYGISVAAAAYTHYTSVFVLIALFAWAFIAHPESRRPLLLSTVGAALLYIPWIPELLDDRNEPAARIIEALHPLTLDHAWHDLGQWAFGNPNIPVQELPGRVAIWLLAAGVLLAVIGVVLRGLADRPRPWWRPSAGLVMVLVLAFATPVGAVLHNIVAESTFVPRNLISSWPGLALLTGALVTAPRAPLRYVAAGLVIAGFAIGAVKMLDSDNQRPDYDAVADFIEDTAAPGDPVVDTPEPTPGPQTAMEAALAPAGDAVPPGRPVLELDFPTIETRLDAVRRGGAFGALLPFPSPDELARQAAADAQAGDGRIFLTGPDVPLPIVRALGGPVAEFLAALPPGYHEVERRSYPGLYVFPVGVHVLEQSAGP